jgi:hypothetical protein
MVNSSAGDLAKHEMWTATAEDETVESRFLPLAARRHPLALSRHELRAAREPSCRIAISS